MSERRLEQLNRFLDAAMANEGIRNDAELARLAGVSQNQISTIRNEKAVPSIPTLAKLAAPLGVPPRNLYILAGHIQPGEDEMPSQELHPPEIRDLLALYYSVKTDEHRRLIREQVGIAVRGLAALIGDRASSAKPTRRRTA